MFGERFYQPPDAEIAFAKKQADAEKTLVKKQGTREYEPSSAIKELQKTKVIFEKQITPETRVCLIGDGQGLDTKQFFQMGVRPEKISSVNYEQSEVDQANEGVLRDTGVRMKQGDATSLESLKDAGIEENSQEVVTLMHVLEVPVIKGDAERALVENAVKILQPGGELMVTQYKHQFTKDERDVQRRIGIEEITAENLKKQFGENWREAFREEYGIEWEEGMRYGEISNIRTQEQLRKLFEPYFDVRIEETESEYVLRMRKK